jgi:hypothetical protein
VNGTTSRGYIDNVAAQVIEYHLGIDPELIIGHGEIEFHQVDIALG